MLPNLVTHEFRYLLEQLKKVLAIDLLYSIFFPPTNEMIYDLFLQNPNVDMENHWKLLTIFAGANDLCLG